MTKESLERARELIIFGLKDSTIDIIDCTELMTNLWLYLNPTEYDNNNKVLQKSINDRRK